MFKREEEVAAFRSEIRALAAYLKSNGVARRDRAKLVAYRHVTFKRVRGDALLEGFPTAVRTTVQEKRYRDVLARTNIFRGVSRRVVLAVLAAAHEEHFLEEMRLWSEGDVPTVCYLLHSGEVDVVVEDGASKIAEDPSNESKVEGLGPEPEPRVVATFTRGAVLGGAAVFGGAPLQTWTLVARTPATVVAVPADAFARHEADACLVLQNLRKDAEALANRARTSEVGAHHRRLRSRSLSGGDSWASSRPAQRAVADAFPSPDDDDGGARDTTRFARVGRSDAWAAKLDAAAASLASVEARTASEVAETLCDLAARGDANRLAAMLAHGGRRLGADVADYDGRTPAHLAATHGRVDVLRLLDDFGLALGNSDAFGGTPILDAALKAPPDSADAAVAFLRNRAGALAVDGLGELLCKHAAASEVLPLKRLLAAGADPDSKDYDHRRALHVAAAEGAAAAAAALLDAGADVNAADRWGSTPLRDAVAWRRLQICKLLIARGGDVHAVDRRGVNVVDAALESGSDDCLREVVNAGGTLKGARDGATRLCAAASAGDLRLVEKLVSAGLEPDTADYDRRTALMLAAAENKWSVAAKLVELGADLRRKDRWGKDAVDAAADDSMKQRLRLLLDA
mmetsp:Transcript_35650/g.107261  ORF Transcript_35650/g.107261 Transcript_35650/m.107261 type:complete len:629 (-) Transcript_35650:100-1986(-)